MSSTFLGNEKEETKLFLKPEYFKNRELSWMDFNDRVLEEARNKDNPAGKSYKVNGYIIGDETTEQGFPVAAEVKVVKGESDVPRNAVAHTLPLSDVTLNGDNRLTWNRDEAIREICSWDVTQQL